jgi:hypothetical protein
MGKGNAWPPAAPGARRMFDRYAWVRAWTDAEEIAEMTRHLLLRMAFTMDPDGSRCTVGARGMAKMMGCNKTTVSEHRLIAIRLGWLLPPTAPPTAPRHEWLPCVPASVATLTETPALSGLAGQLNDEVLSGYSRVTVRVQPRYCPAQPDKPPLTTLKTTGTHAQRAPGSKAGTRARATETRTPTPWEALESEGDRRRRQLLGLEPVLGLVRQPAESETAYLDRIERVNQERISRTVGP